MADPQEGPDMRTVMIEGYRIWKTAPPVDGLGTYLTIKHPDATPLEIDNHILLYTLVKLVAYLQPDPDDADGEKREPWQM